MKKRIFCFVMMVALCFAGASEAAAPKKLSVQQNRMKACAGQYRAKKIPKHDYRKFMSQCLRKNPAAPAAKAKAATAAVPAAIPASAPAEVPAPPSHVLVTTSPPASSIPMIQVPVIVSPASAVQTAPLAPVPVGK